MRPRRLFAGALLLGGLLALALLARAWLQRGAAGSPQAARPFAASEAVALPDEALASGDPQPARREPDRTAAGITVERTAAGPDARSTVDVRVVAKQGGAPVPGARVLSAPVPATGNWWEAPAWKLETIDEWMRDHGEPLEADAEGLVQVPVEEGGARALVGTAPGLWGRTRVTAASEKPRRLELVHDATIEVLTLDVGGAPRAGVPVALRSTGDGWPRDRVTVVTDAGGAARMQHVGLVMDDRRATVIWSLAVAALTVEPVERRLDPDALPGEPVVLTLPATGSLEVTVDELSGGPSGEGGRVALLRLAAGGATRRTNFWTRPATVEAPIRSGRANFGHVQTGLELEVQARGPRSLQPTVASGRGPQLPGETARITLVLGSDHPVLRMRLVDSQSRPLAARAVRAELLRTTVFSLDSNNEELETDSEGVLFVDLERDWAEGGRRELTLSVNDPDGHPGGSARLDLARPFPDGLSDLGDVRLAPAVVIAAGRVEDAGGAAVAEARINVQVPRAWSGESNWYEERSDLGTTAAADGTFEVIGSIDAASVRLTASSEGLSGEPVEIDAGARGVVLRVAATGRVPGRVALDEGVPAENLMIWVGPPDEEDHQRKRWGWLREDGSFSVEGVPPGVHDLQVRTRQSSDALAVVAGIQVLPGTDCADPRLDPIDLRGLLCSVTLELVPPRAGMPVVGIVVLRPAGGEPGDAAEKTRFFQGQRVVLTAAAPALDLDVLAQGFRRVHLEGVRDDRRVDLEEGPLVRLRLPPDLELPSPPRYLKAFLGAEKEFWQLGHMQEAVFDEGGELVVRVQGPGRLEVRWMLEERTESTISTTTIGATDLTVDVLDVPGEQVFDIAPDAEAYAAAIARWRDG